MRAALPSGSLLRATRKKGSVVTAASTPGGEQGFGQSATVAKTVEGRSGRGTGCFGRTCLTHSYDSLENRAGPAKAGADVGGLKPLISLMPRIISTVAAASGSRGAEALGDTRHAGQGRHDPLGLAPGQSQQRAG